MENKDTESNVIAENESSFCKFYADVEIFSDAPLWWKRNLDVDFKSFSKKKMKELEKERANYDDEFFKSKNALKSQLENLKKENYEIAKKMEKSKDIVNEKYLQIRNVIKSEKEIKNLIDEIKTFNLINESDLKQLEIITEASGFLTEMNEVYFQKKSCLALQGEFIKEALPESVLVQNEDNLKTHFFSEYKKYPSFDSYKNIMEIIDLTLRDKARAKNILTSVNAYIRKQGITLLFCDNKEVANSLLATLNRDYGSDFGIIRGEVRIDGVVASNYLKQDFKNEFKNYISSFSNVMDELLKHKKTISNYIDKIQLDLRDIENLSKMFNVNKDCMNKKASDLNMTELYLITLMILLIDKKTIKILPIMTENADIFNSAILKVVEKIALKYALIIVSEDKNIINRLNHFTLYTIK